MWRRPSRGLIVLVVALFAGAMGQAARPCPHHTPAPGDHAAHGRPAQTPAPPCSCFGNCHVTSATPCPAGPGAVVGANPLPRRLATAVPDVVLQPHDGLPSLARSPPVLLLIQSIA